MKVLTIGTDRKIFEEGSAVQERALEYLEKVEEYHVVVFSLKTNNLHRKKIGNLHIYPTNSSSRIGYIWDAIKIGKGIVPDSNINVISTQDPFECGFVGYKIAKKFAVPLQLQIHTDFLSPYFKNSFLNRVRVQIAKYIIPKAQGLRVVSSVIADSIKKQFPNLKAKIDVLPIFVDIEKMILDVPKKDIHAEYPQFEKIVLMASRLSPEKQIDVALFVFKKVLAQFPKVGLVISGVGSEKKSLIYLTHKLGIEDSVVFTGWESDLLSYLKTADAFMLTSEFEGYGMTLIEAAASGCPIVTTQVGIAKTDVFKNGKNSFVCPIGDTECLVKALAELISNSPKRELFKGGMQDSIKSVTISKEEYVSEYIALLQHLLD